MAAAFPHQSPLIQRPVLSGKTTSKVKDTVQGEKIFNISYGSRVEISAVTTPRQIQVSKCPRCGSRRHLQFQEADLCVSKTSVQSTSCLESRWKLHVNSNVLAANGYNKVLRNAGELKVVNLCMYTYGFFLMCVYICVYIKVLPPLDSCSAPKSLGYLGI